MVGVAGLEPAASRSQTERSSQLSHTPKMPKAERSIVKRGF